MWGSTTAECPYSKTPWGKPVSRGSPERDTRGVEYGDMLVTATALGPARIRGRAGSLHEARPGKEAGTARIR